jgi:hypothetical protein
MDVPSAIKVSATINGHRYSASLAGEGVVIVGNGRALATGRFVGGKFADLRPSPPDFFIQIPTDELDVVDRLAEELRAAMSGQGQAGAS